MKPIKHSLTLSIACVFALALPACSGLRSGASGPGAEASPAPSGRTLATPRADGRTAEGGFVDGFAFAEKPGDVTLNPVSFSSGTVRATGLIEPRHGSTWGGIALTTSLSRGSRTLDASSARMLAISLASTGSGQLRVRLVGPNTAVRDSGCYPVAIVRVVPELKDYTVPIASFAPESFCASNAPSGVTTAAALTAVEVADAVVTPGVKRQVDFTVGVIRMLP
jgi:hypothetical protein